MESRKQTYIAAFALIVSIISLAITYINEYRENLEVVAENISIVSTDTENNILNCEIELIVANTSRHTVPLIKCKAYKTYSGLKSSRDVSVCAEPEFPLTLISGGAEKMLLKFQYHLDNVDLSSINNEQELYEILKKQWVSIRIYTTKSNPYYANARFGN